MAAIATFYGNGVVSLTHGRSLLLFARPALRRRRGLLAIATQATTAPSRGHCAPQQDYRTASCNQWRGPTMRRQASRSVPSAVDRVTCTRASQWPAPGSSQLCSRTRTTLLEASYYPQVTRRGFSSSLRCSHEDDKGHGVPADPPPPAATPKPRRSILGATAHEDIYNIPNFLTFTRLLAGPGLAYLIVNSSHVAALGLFIYAGVTDALDGYLARRWKQTSVVGSVVDPMADKTLMTAATLALAAQARMPWPLAIIILGRDVLLAISAIYYRWISLPPPKTMTRYWDFSLPSAEVRPTTISKVNTGLQLVLIGATVAMPLVPESITVAWKLGEALVGLQWTVGLTTIWSGLSYVGSKDAVRILGQDGKPKGE